MTKVMKKAIAIFMAALMTFSTMPTLFAEAKTYDWDWPTPEAWILQDFDEHGYVRIRPEMTDRKTFSFDVVAADDGVVEISLVGDDCEHAPRFSGYGNTLVIRHADGLYTLYSHLSTLYVEEGRVKRGETIGVINTKKGDGKCLYFGKLSHYSLSEAKVTDPIKAANYYKKYADKIKYGKDFVNTVKTEKNKTFYTDLLNNYYTLNTSDDLYHKNNVPYGNTAQTTASVFGEGNAYVVVAGAVVIAVVCAVTVIIIKKKKKKANK